MDLYKFFFNEFYVVLYGIIKRVSSWCLRVAKMNILSVGLGCVCGLWLLRVSPAFRTLTLVNRERASFLHICGLLLRHWTLLFC